MKEDMASRMFESGGGWGLGERGDGDEGGHLS